MQGSEAKACSAFLPPAAECSNLPLSNARDGPCSLAAGQVCTRTRRGPLGAQLVGTAGGQTIKEYSCLVFLSVPTPTSSNSFHCYLDQIFPLCDVLSAVPHPCLCLFVKGVGLVNCVCVPASLCVCDWRTAQLMLSSRILWR